MAPHCQFILATGEHNKINTINTPNQNVRNRGIGNHGFLEIPKSHLTIQTESLMPRMKLSSILWKQLSSVLFFSALASALQEVLSFILPSQTTLEDDIAGITYLESWTTFLTCHLPQRSRGFCSVLFCFTPLSSLFLFVLQPQMLLL